MSTKRARIILRGAHIAVLEDCDVMHLFYFTYLPIKVSTHLPLRVNFFRSRISVLQNLYTSGRSRSPHYNAFCIDLR